MWVVYFSLAALPIFGIGQWLIPVADAAGRRQTFWLLCVYVASGLGLLLTTSFLGLRRYLRQRRIEMPALMANVWLSAGVAIILLLLVVAALLPRPSAEYAISQLPISVGSPEQDSSDVAPVEREGTEDQQPGRAAADQQDRDSDAPPPGGAGNQPGGQAEGDNAGTTDSAQSSSGQSQGEGDSQAAGQKDAAGGQSSGGQSSGGQSSSSQSGGSQGKSSANADAKSPQSQQSAQGERSGGKDAQSKQDSEGKKESQFVQAVKRYRRQQREIEEEYGFKEPKQSPEESEPPDESSQAEQMPMPPDTALSPLMTLVRWAFYLAFALAVLYALWRYRREVLAAIRGFIEELRNWWASLWGRRDYGLAAAETVDVRVPPPAFSTFADPFASGVAGRYSVEELVRYSFDAFEAWSREHGCPRGPDETPHELAREVARLNASIGEDARNLANLYSQAAYGRARLDEGARDQMLALWRQMTRRPLAAAR